VEDWEQAYAYSRPSTVASAGGRTTVALATSGGQTLDGPQRHPVLFDGFVDHPDQTAQSLLVCARVARTRFYVPPSMVAAQIRAADPVVTSNGDRLRFEAFSACAGVYVRFDALAETLETAPSACGTTNVDVNPPMRELLAQVGGRDPLHLQVGHAGEVAVTTLEGRAVERKVPLPRRWLRGFAEAQVACAAMVPRVEWSAAEARRFLQALPASGRRPRWVAPSGRTARVTVSPAAGAVCLAGPERLRVLLPLLRFATGLRAYGPAVDDTTDAAASAWELSMPGARVVVAVSPDAARGFSGEGGALIDLAYDSADDGPDDDLRLVEAMLAWQPHIDLADISERTGLTTVRVRRALVRLSTAGRAGYDLAEGSFFHRWLPYDNRVVEAGLGRLRDARSLAEQGAVRAVTDDVAAVDSGGVTYRVVLGPDGDRCTCPWWGRHRGTRGPCKHVLAARMEAQR
jgi:SWIM zinc finger